MVPRPPRCTRTDTLFPYNDALPIARRGRRPLRHAEGEAQADHDHVGLIFRIDAGTGAGVDSEYQTHMVMVGLRFTFGVPERAAPAPRDRKSVVVGKECVSTSTSRGARDH